MIRGYLSSIASRQRPFVGALFQFPTLGNRQLTVELLIDTGSDRTVLAPLDAMRLGIDVGRLPAGRSTRGIGGKVPTKTVQAVLTLDSFSMALPLTILMPRRSIPPIPSVLGRDVLSNFALFFEVRSQRVLLLEPAEAAQIHLP
jgi:hypothetical protein